MESMRQAELAPSTPALRPLNTGESKDQLISEGCWETPRGLQCPSRHPSNEPTPVFEETEDGFVVGMDDPAVTNGNYWDRRLHQELLEIINRHDDWSPAQQHDFLFRRWDECREDSVGNEARTSIEEFIRRQYPQGTSREISEKELRGFNERRVTENQSFCPYGCLAGMELQEPELGGSLQ